ncbi:hypothetical protein [Gottfriedia acidiceleris]|uniref:Uncharacterized protein n=1 Tax=Gottfriedia acidiceleris TaxID=371036 RepID=A0ABY4JSP6_9BACI|nr:hypothetical protein [Gottfriedia acidiceleris]UPM56379.1 hypothetical protein MY490_11305 [Gottfriedia acidiceleris]
MSTEKKIKVRLVVEIDVLLDVTTKMKIEQEYGKEMSDLEAAEFLAYAYLNPKIYSLNEEEVSGEWDNVCDFNGKLGRVSLETD